MPHPIRHIALAPRGKLLVSTDVHGDGVAFRALEDRWRAHLASDSRTHWAILGDIVHAPNPEFRQHHPTLYNYPDESGWIIRRIHELRAEAPDLVHFVLGNHDYAHVGGPPTRKFYHDEAAHLESLLSPDDLALLRELFENALLAISTPCGLLLTHGAPNASWGRLDDLDRITQFPPEDPKLIDILDGVLFAYGQRPDIIDTLCHQLSNAPDFPHPRPLRVVVHGHDRDEEGWFTEGHNQIVPVIFGAPRHNQRYLFVALDTYYQEVASLRDGVEVRRLF